MPVGSRVADTLRAFVSGVAYRRGIAGLIVVVAAAAATSVAVGPNYREAAGVSALRSRMVTVSPASSGVEVAAATWPGDSPDRVLAKLVPRLPLSTGAVPGMSVGGQTTLQVPGAPLVEFSSLTWRQDDCAHVVFASGRCPRARNEIALPVGAARVLGARLGGVIKAANLDHFPYGLGPDINNHTISRQEVAAAGPRKMIGLERVVGLFVVPKGQSGYWFGQPIDAPVVSAEGDNGAQISEVTALVPRIALTRLPIPYVAVVTVDQTLAWSRATPAVVTPLLSAINRLRHSLNPTMSLFTSVPSLTRAAASDRTQLNHLIALADLQLVLLVGLVMVAVLATSFGQRRTELVAATLDGQRPLFTALRLAVEPCLLVIIGLVPGVALSVPLTRLAARVWLRAGTPVRVQAQSLTEVVAVAAIAVVVTVVLGFVAACRPLSDQVAGNGGAGGGRGGTWIDIGAMTLAGAGLIELFENNASGTSTPWSLLAPSLCGLAAGLALARLAPSVLRPVVRVSAHSPNLGRYLAIRELQRDRAAWRVTAVVAMALSLLCFAATINQGTSSDRLDRAGLIVGAPTVAIVSTPAASTPTARSLLRAVDRADPAGQWAMAAVLIEPFLPAAQRDLAIDASRLPAVAGWSRRIDSLTPGGIASLLTAKAPRGRPYLPVLAAGGVDGLVFGLSNTALANTKTFNTSVLPELLNQGSLTDLPTLIAAAPPVPTSQLGTTRLIDQVWIGAQAPTDALQRLRTAGLTIDSVSTRKAAAGDLERGAQAAGLAGYRAVAILAAVLAIALLIGTSVAAAARTRSEALALTLAGFARRDVRYAQAIAIGGRLLVAGIAAFGCGVLTAHLAAHHIPQASPGAIPATLLPLPWPPGVVAIALALIPAFLAQLAISSYGARRADTAGLRVAT